MISDYFILAIRNLRKRKLRSWLTMIGIFISIATIFVLISLSLGLQGAVEEQFRQLGTDKFFIQPKGQLAGPGTTGAVTLTEEDAKTADRVSGVIDYTFFVLTSAKIEYKGEIRFVNVGGVPLDSIDLYLESTTTNIDEGRKLQRGDSGDVMIGSQYKRNNYVNQQVQVGDKILVNDREFKVRGILEPVGNPPDDRIVYMAEDDFRELFNITDRVDMIIAQTGEGANVTEVAERVEKRLLSSRDLTEKTQDFTILTPEQLLESFGAILAIITGFLVAVAGISLLVGGIGIANTMFTSVLERRKEIGIMKAIGAKNSDITLIFLIESGLLGLIGGLIGVLLGFGIGQAIEYVAVNQLGTNLLAVTTPIWLFIGCLAFGFLSGAVSGTLPAIQASKVRPTEALRYE